MYFDPSRQEDEGDELEAGKDLRHGNERGAGRQNTEDEG